MGAASIAIVAAQAAMSAASAYGQHKAGQAQEHVNKAEATLEHSQQDLQLARTAAIESEKYRRNLATAVATASARGGAGMARQIGSQYEASFNQDLQAIDRARRVNDIRKINRYAAGAGNSSTTSLGAITGLGKDILGASALQIGLGSTTKSPIAPVDNSAIARFKPNIPTAPTSNIAGTISGKYDPLGQSKW